jgi:hypothetical protein
VQRPSAQSDRAVKGVGSDPFIEAITKTPDLDTSFVMMESFGISLTVKKP